MFGGLYWQQGVADGLNFYGLFLNAGMHVAFANISEMSSAVENKYIAYRHTANNVHPVFSYPLAAIITHLPVAILESLSFSAISYFMCGLTPEAGQFFFFFLVVLSCALGWRPVLAIGTGCPVEVLVDAGAMPGFRFDKRCCDAGCRAPLADHAVSTCAGCNVATYCDKDCQRADWAAGHKQACAVKKR